MGIVPSSDLVAAEALESSGRRRAGVGMWGLKIEPMGKEPSTYGEQIHLRRDTFEDYLISQEISIRA